MRIQHTCYSTKLRCRIPVTVLPSGHLALALTPSGSFETTGETKTLVKETACRYEKMLLSIGTAFPSLNRW